MKPVICFYKNEKYIYSEDYSYLENQTDLMSDFLNKINEQYHDIKKIIQIDFNKKTQRIFILKNFEILSFDQVIKLGNPLAETFEYICEISKTEYINSIQKIKADIYAGRFYQMNYTSSFRSKISNVPGLDYFTHYFKKFKARYAAYLPVKDFEILCYSPELFLRKENHLLVTEPIKGTLISKDGHANLTNEKETAELSMIVDLLRNDLNQISEKPATVNFHQKILDLNYTKHTYSQIQADTQKSLGDILNSVLPAGSISGCPKLESLYAISEYENYDRQFYTGILGWWEKDNCELNVTIRSFKKTENHLEYFAGCGIVADPEPENEWLEFLVKSCHLENQHKKL